ncbi:hypothetical protein DIS24_g8946 [Lasiodiplodia hormozganensis]|uniref:Peptidase S8/S53 domain-containing protein n=1 Tax=Lasiodiplodia hormozganensis TaxID=869390 RepID=A0AA40CMK6_9PEZI|nr:hypothetical protein DIS24_g8946 [Lasiodiplodia hormozganensis]
MLGHNVLSQLPEQVPLEKYNLLTGASVTTASASGLAALILYCVQFATLTKPSNASGFVTMDNFGKMKLHDERKMAFGRIPTEPSRRGIFLLVGHLFHTDEPDYWSERGKHLWT